MQQLIVQTIALTHRERIAPRGHNLSADNGGLLLVASIATIIAIIITSPVGANYER